MTHRLDPLGVVAKFLLKELDEGPVTAFDLETRARKAGLLGNGQRITHSKLFKRAKKSLGIRSVRSGFGSKGKWVWLLDEQPAQSHPEDAEQPSNAHSEVKAEASGEHGDGAASPSRIPRDWIEGVAALDYHRPQADVPSHRWRQFVDDCNNFLSASENGATRAARLSWDAVALFGCRRERPLEHLGSAGLLWAINGGRLLELHRDWAVVELPVNGSRRVHQRRRRLDAANLILPWRGFRRQSG
jgi:hypothetical protein